MFSRDTDWPTHCVRCAGPLNVSIMSKFDTAMVCLPCHDDERLAPGYVAAVEAEMNAVRSGVRNFPGVGLSTADRIFLADRFALRRARAGATP
jgi:hypothetical protein